MLTAYLIGYWSFWLYLLVYLDLGGPLWMELTANTVLAVFWPVLVGLKLMKWALG